MNSAKKEPPNPGTRPTPQTVGAYGQTRSALQDGEPQVPIEPRTTAPDYGSYQGGEGQVE